MADEEQFFIYKPVTNTHVEQLMSAATPEALRTSMRTIFSLTATDEPTEILLDFHVKNFTFAKQQRFTFEKVSCFMGVMDYVFHSSLNQRLNQSSCYERFRRSILKHSAQRPPYSIAVFSLADVQKLTQFTLTSFFTSYALYEHAFTPHTDMLLITGTRFESSFPPVQQLTMGKQIDPSQVPELTNYLSLHCEEESHTKDDVSTHSVHDKEDSVILDPFQQMVQSELKALESALEEKMKKREEEILSKLAAAKK